MLKSALPVDRRWVVSILDSEWMWGSYHYYQCQGFALIHQPKWLWEFAFPLQWRRLPLAPGPSLQVLGVLSTLDYRCSNRHGMETWGRVGLLGFSVLFLGFFFTTKVQKTCFLVLFYFCICLFVLLWVGMPQCICRNQRTPYKSGLSPHHVVLHSMGHFLIHSSKWTGWLVTDFRFSSVRRQGWRSIREIL